MGLSNSLGTFFTLFVELGIIFHIFLSSKIESNTKIDTYEF